MILLLFKEIFPILYIIMNKTLIGREGYLFLQNDSAGELEIHCNNICTTNNNTINMYRLYNNFMLIIFPDKTIVYNIFLPDGYTAKYRPSVDIYKQLLSDKVIDTYDIVKNIDSFYKTDTHMNFLAAYECYIHTINEINRKFSINIVPINIKIDKKECILSETGIGIGDLTWEMNLGNQILDSKIDNYYYTNDISNVYCTYNINNNGNIRILNNSFKDITRDLENNIIDWNIISKYILYTNNSNCNKKFKTLIFYDSFLLSTLNLWIQTLSETYFVKSIFNPQLIDIIKPDYIFEFRLERYLR
jgi:hypothetical protein